MARCESQLVIPVLETGSESTAQQQPQPPPQQEQQFKTEKRFMVELETKGEEQKEFVQLSLKQQQRQHRSGGGGVVGPTYRSDPVYGQWRWDDSRLAPFGNAGDVPPMGYVPVQPPPGALPPRPPPPAGSGPPCRGTPIAPRLCFKCQQPGNYAAQCTAHAHAHVAQNYPPSSGCFGAHAASFILPPSIIRRKLAGRSIP